VGLGGIYLEFSRFCKGGQGSRTEAGGDGVSVRRRQGKKMRGKIGIWDRGGGGVEGVGQEERNRKKTP
jgi:hypothetical protein